MREQSVDSFYANLRESALSSSSSPVLIFPSTSDVDSLCALKIIFHILESDSIQYACYPVSTFHQIHKYTSSASNQDPLSIVLVNCGNHRDLRKELTLRPNARKMKEEFERFLPEYGLTDFYYRSFQRTLKYSSKVSAADVVYGVTALLESSSASKQFGVAYDALSLNNFDNLRTGMQHAIKIQRAILRQGSAAITKNGCIRSGRSFRWLRLEDSCDAKLLGYPQALTKFCYFLMDALKEKGATMKPLLCACVSQEPGKVLIVGVCGRPRLAGARGNAFGIAFRAAAEEIGTEFFHELFESSWIVLDISAVNSFMVRLIEKL